MKRPAVIALAIVGMIAALWVGYLIKNRCTTHQWDGYQYRTSCYNDIFALYSFRGLAKQPIPYIHGDGVLDNERVETDGSVRSFPAAGATGTEVGDLEYPVLTGFFIAFFASVTGNGVAFFRATSLGLGLVALFALGCIVPMTQRPWRLLYFAIAPSLVLYAFHNWDLFAVALMCIGLYSFWHGEDAAAGAALGLGAAAKVFPGLIVPALMLARRQQGRRWWAVGGGAALAFLAVNVPLALMNRKGWQLPWQFQATRFPNFETSWFNIYRHLQGHFGDFWSVSYPKFTSYLAGGLFAIGGAFYLWSQARRERIRPYASSFALLLIFLLTAKVYSPQYALWVLPFFVLVQIPWYAFLAFAVTDAAVWFAISAFFLAAPPLNHGDPEFRIAITEVLVWARYAVLLWLIVLTTRSDELVSPEPTQSTRAATPEVPLELPA